MANRSHESHAHMHTDVSHAHMHTDVSHAHMHTCPLTHPVTPPHPTPLPRGTRYPDRWIAKTSCTWTSCGSSIVQGVMDGCVVYASKDGARMYRWAGGGGQEGQGSRWGGGAGWTDGQERGEQAASLVWSGVPLHPASPQPGPNLTPASTDTATPASPQPGPTLTPASTDTATHASPQPGPTLTPTSTDTATHAWPQPDPCLH